MSQTTGKKLIFFLVHALTHQHVHFIYIECIYRQCVYTLLSLCYIPSNMYRFRYTKLKLPLAVEKKKFTVRKICLKVREEENKFHQFANGKCDSIVVIILLLLFFRCFVFLRRPAGWQNLKKDFFKLDNILLVVAACDYKFFFK